MNYFYLRVHCQDTIQIVEYSVTIKMVTAKSLVMYKIGYNPDGKNKHKSVEIAFSNSAIQMFEIPIVSGTMSPDILRYLRYSHGENSSTYSHNGNGRYTYRSLFRD